MESVKSKMGAFSAINSDPGATSDDMNHVPDSTHSGINSENELENGTDTSQQNTDNEMPFAELDDDLKPQTDKEVNVDNEKSKKRPNWTPEATRLVLDLAKETLPKFRKDDGFRDKTKMYNHLSNEMKKQGFKFSPCQIENKVYYYKRQYIRARGKNSAYQSDVEQIFGESLKNRDKDEDTDSDSNSDMEDTTEANIVDPRTARVQREVQRELQKTLVKIATERQEYHNKVLYYLKRKEEREQRREERAQKKLKLLQAFLKQL